MLETLRAWLNGKRDYNTGVAIYEKLDGYKEDLLTLFKKGKNDFRERRLQEELLEICKKLKSQINGICNKPDIGDNSTIHSGSQTGNILHTQKQNASTVQNGRVLQLPEKGEGPNPELYRCCKVEADNAYKRWSNQRAILFELARCENWENPNLPHKVKERKPLALATVIDHKEVSRLYDIADYVFENGRLPDQPPADENIYDNIPDHQVKETLNNVRKAYNKLKNKESNPERVVLMQKHQLHIKKLNERWLSLKQ